MDMDRSVPSGVTQLQQNSWLCVDDCTGLVTCMVEVPMADALFCVDQDALGDTVKLLLEDDDLCFSFFCRRSI